MAITSIIDTSNKVPGIYLQVTLGVGRRSPGAAPMNILLVGNKIAAGSLAAATPTNVFSADDVADVAGEGSELHLMAQAVFGAYPSATVTIVGVAESAGAAATGSLVVSGTAAAAGTVEVWVGGRRVVAAIASGDTATVIGDSIEAAINGDTDSPVTASNAAGTVTVTAKNKGPRGNFVRLRSLLTGASGVTHSAVNAYLTGGTTSDDPQNALDAVASTRYRLIVAPYADSTNLAKFEAHIDAVSAPEVGLRGRFLFATQDTLANAITLSDAVNAKRGQLFWHYNAEDTPGEIAAACAGLLAKELSSDRAKPLDGYTVPGLQPQYSDADKPINSELVSALNNGITPLDHDGSSVFLVRSITNYSTDAQSNPDFSVLDTSKVDVPDFIADALELSWLSEFQGYKLDNDPEDPTDAPEPGVATPSSIRDWAYSILRTYAAGGSGPLLLSNVEALAEQLVFEIDSASDGRVNGVVPVDVVEGLHQGALDVQQIG